MIDERRVHELLRRLPDQAARDEVIAECLPLARHLARRFSGRGQEHEDLVQVAAMGLVKAVDRFDPTLGKPFLGYAIPTMMGELKRHFRDRGWGVHVPRRMKDLSMRVRNAALELAQTLGRLPTVEEIAAFLEVPADEVLEVASVGNAYRPDCLDGTTGSDERPAIDTIGEWQSDITLFDDLDALRPLLERQPERERLVLYLRFFDDLTQREIAERIGVSQMHVSRILSRTLSRLRELMPA